MCSIMANNYGLLKKLVDSIGLLLINTHLYTFEEDFQNNVSFVIYIIQMRCMINSDTHLCQ